MPVLLKSHNSVLLLATFLVPFVIQADETLLILEDATGIFLDVDGGDEDEWQFQTTADLANWQARPDLGTILEGGNATTILRVNPTDTNGPVFYRALKTDGLYDTSIFRTVNLTFAENNWQTLMHNNKASGTNLAAGFATENGFAFSSVGVRYKGNSSYSQNRPKNSINIELDHNGGTDKWMGYKTINLNNHNSDNTVMREVLYFNAMVDYAPGPRCNFAKLYINGDYWGVYCHAQQENSELVKEWFPSNDGDRWRAPNVGGGTGTGGPGGGFGGGGPGGGFTGGGSAFLYLGSGQVSDYQSNYELKGDNPDSARAWQRLADAIAVLHNSSVADFPDRVDAAFAVDSWLWLLAVENVFTDDDSYWNKGADYGFYYEAESGRIQPIEHDGNEAFTAADTSLSPMEGEGNSNRPLLSKLLAVPEYRQRYLAHMRVVIAENFNPGYLNPRIDTYRALIADAVASDPKVTFTQSGFESAITSLKSQIQSRYNYLTSHAELIEVAPTIMEVSEPAPPQAGQPATITARVVQHADEGIGSVWLYHRPGSAGRFIRTQMFDDGNHGDGAAGDGFYGAQTVGYLAGVKVRYYVEARSANSSATCSFLPAHAEQDTFNYRVGAGAPGESAIVINEFLASNSETLADPQGEFDDWIELHNVTSSEVEVGGMFLSDNPENPRKWELPAGTVIPGGGFLLVWADEDGDTATEGLHANFKLSASGEQILLSDVDASFNSLLDLVEFGSQQTDMSSGRHSSSPTVFVPMTPTPGGPNE